MFVHVSRCLIYKVHRPFAQPIWKVIRTSSGSRPPFRSNFYIIARIVQLVKHFFQFLSKSFVVWRPVSSGSAILSNNHPNVKHFFDFFAGHNRHFAKSWKNFLRNIRRKFHETGRKQGRKRKSEKSEKSAWQKEVCMVLYRSCLRETQTRKRMSHERSAVYLVN